ncbi:MAG: glycogen/starch/alpha-glucan phosphorylase, partial [Firmicutes bacterium]|nr:glycogen/starch/alpha-glucan phosphorylase [Bacillota bacterium]
MGRSLVSNALNLLQTDLYQAALAELGLSLEKLESEAEPEAGLGNGGLGRLAACFMDSLATLNLPAMACGIRYEYGLFRQKIDEAGNQIETPDDWLQNGNAWEVPDMSQAMEVRFGGTIKEVWQENGLKIIHTDYQPVIAVPYDMPIAGYGGGAATLRLWSARAPQRLDMKTFQRGEYAQSAAHREWIEAISKVLYPEDNNHEGKMLRLRQHYFFTSASVQYIIRDFKQHYPDLPLTMLPEKAVIHINDTHPALAIPELMRILLDEEGLSWSQAYDVCRGTFAYTNHTVMSEALEKWPEDMMKELLPRVYAITRALNEVYCARLWEAFPGQWQKISDMSIIANGQVRMANLCCAVSFAVNGVSQLHARILREDVFRNVQSYEPGKIIGITNGITFRRWLNKANPGLTNLIEETIGDGYRRDAALLRELAAYAGDAAFCVKFAEVKHQNKERLAKYVKENLGQTIDPDSIFDVQAKRLHEYKRQLLNVLNILHMYDEIVAGRGEKLPPRTFFFAAKASPGYDRAKLIIRLIHSVARMIEKHPVASKKIKVVFLPNYCVSLAETLIPAADISEQISTAGKEASGTGNMKFMLNGAVTVGTLDGANVEISEAVGMDSIFIFGLTAPEAAGLYRAGRYHPGEIYEQNTALRCALDHLIDGSLDMDYDRQFSSIYQSLLFGDYGMADPYLLLADFDAYRQTQR